MKYPTRLWFPCFALLSCCLFLPSTCPAAALDDLVIRLRQFSYGQDATVLTELEDRVGVATGQTVGQERRHVLAEKLASILESNASEESKQFVCRQLAIIGTVRQVPVLAKLLGDPVFSDIARYALGQIPDPAVDNVLRNALSQSSGAVRVGIINTLGYRRDRDAVEPLGKLLNSDDLECAQAAASALGRISGAAAARLLKVAWAAVVQTNRLDLGDAYLACAQNFPAADQKDQAALIYQDLFDPTNPAWIRAAALRGLVRMGTGGIALAAGALREQDPVLIQAAIGSLGFISDPEATRTFAAELVKLPVGLQPMLLNALAERGDPEALLAAKDAAASADPQVRMAALRAIGALGNQSMVTPLIGVARQGDAESKVALIGLRRLRGEGVNAGITLQLDRVDPSVQIQLISVLADRHALEAVPTFVRLAQRPDPLVALAATKAIGEIAQPSALSDLLKLLSSSTSDTVREAAADAMVPVARRIADPTHQADLLLSAYRNAIKDSTRASLLRVLGGIANFSALEVIQGAVHDVREPVRDAALRALSDWPNSLAIETLLSVFAQTQNPTHRALALRGLVRLADPGLGEQSPPQRLRLYQQVLPNLQGSEEVRLVLSGLALMTDPQVLPMLDSYLNDEATREEAAAAVVKVSTALASTAPDAARQAIQRVLALSTNPATRQQAADLLQALTKK